MKTIGTKLDNSEYEIFDFCCNEKGLTKSEMLRKLIQNFLDTPILELKDHSKTLESVNKTSMPKIKITRISYDGKTWFDINTENIDTDI